ncbi:hypothetical protein E2C01_041902 [Portunus trituberculatus]|uniref:Uncharacterized protein n=1 Tax=Portunus trituberculatus TaxID=210409 RepID=A0A5B7FUZ4_PORTR|nr:hypothetical protein [Portunus trituberculatus]
MVGPAGDKLGGGEGTAGIMVCQVTKVTYFSLQSITQKGLCKVYEDGVEVFRGCGNGLQQSVGMVVNLGGLARKAGADPLFNLLSHP